MDSPLGLTVVGTHSTHPLSLHAFMATNFLGFIRYSRGGIISTLTRTGWIVMVQCVRAATKGKTEFLYIFFLRSMSEFRGWVYFSRLIFIYWDFFFRQLFLPGILPTLGNLNAFAFFPTFPFFWFCLKGQAWAAGVPEVVYTSS